MGQPNGKSASTLSVVEPDDTADGGTARNQTDDSSSSMRLADLGRRRRERRADEAQLHDALAEEVRHPPARVTDSPTGSDTGADARRIGGGLPAGLLGSTRTGIDFGGSNIMRAVMGLGSSAWDPVRPVREALQTLVPTLAPAPPAWTKLVGVQAVSDVTRGLAGLTAELPGVTTPSIAHGVLGAASRELSDSIISTAARGVGRAPSTSLSRAVLGADRHTSFAAHLVGPVWRNPAASWNLPAQALPGLDTLARVQAVLGVQPSLLKAALTSSYDAMFSQLNLMRVVGPPDAFWHDLIFSFPYRSDHLFPWRFLERQQARQEWRQALEVRNALAQGDTGRAARLAQEFFDLPASAEEVGTLWLVFNAADDDAPWEAGPLESPGQLGRYLKRRWKEERKGETAVWDRTQNHHGRRQRTLQLDAPGPAGGRLADVLTSPLTVEDVVVAMLEPQLDPRALLVLTQTPEREQQVLAALAERKQSWDQVGQQQGLNRDQAQALRKRVQRIGQRALRVYPRTSGWPLVDLHQIDPRDLELRHERGER